MSWVSTAVRVYGAFEAGKDGKRQGELSAIQSDYAAQVEQARAMQEAGIIRRAGAKAVSAANAAFAGAGVKVGEGSAAAVERQINLDSERDAFQALLDGGRRSRAAALDASFARTNGALSQKAGYVNAVNSALSSYREQSGWKTQAPQRTNDISGVNGGNAFDQWARYGVGKD